MKLFLRHKFVLSSLVFLLGISCQKQNYKTPANLTIDHIEITEKNHHQYLEDGVYMPDNPDFDSSNPETWTGNMAQHVVHTYYYSVDFQISNKGESIAYDSEIDLFHLYSTGEEVLETLILGNISGGANITRSTSVYLKNKELEESFGEVYWYDE